MKTLTLRLTLWYAFVVTITVALILSAGRYYLEANLVRGVDFLNRAEFEEVMHRLEGPQTKSDAISLADSIRLHTEIDASLFYFQVGSSNGDILFKSANLAGHTLPPQVHGGGAFSIRDEDLGHLRVSVFAYNGLNIHIASSLDSVDAIFDGYTSTTIWILIVVFIISLVVGVFLSRIALNPINNIQAIARRISAHNLSERIPVPSNKDEISEMSTFLNEMFDRLEGAFQQISRFTADASHELRTPLSLIRLHAERLLGNPELPEKERTAALSEQMVEIERLNKLVDDLLFVAKADAGVLQLSRTDVDILQYLNDFGEDAKLLCEEQKVRFELEQDKESGRFSIDPVWMRHVLLNLLSNALRVSPEGAVIRLRSQLQPEQCWRLLMEDEGPGLDETKIEWIFERFKRSADPAERPELPSGTGLGLAICRSIVSQHNGTIFARKRADRSGLQLCIEIPQS